MTVNPWNVQPKPDVGDASDDITSAAVGRALTEWEEFETQLAFVFAACMGASDPGKYVALRAYGSIVSFSARRGMVEEAMTAVFNLWPNDELQAKWGKLNNEAKEYGARRNEIAHGILSRYAGPSDKTSAGYWGWVIYPAWYNAGKHKFAGFTEIGGWSNPTYAYSSVEIGVFKRGFRDLLVRTATLSHEVATAIKGPPRILMPHG